MDKKGNYPLQIACKYGNYQIAQYLIQTSLDGQSPIDPNINHVNLKGFSAFHYAVELGHLVLMKLLAKHGANQF